MGNSAHKFTAKERRVLITHWVGVAFEKLQGSNYDFIRGIDVSKHTVYLHLVIEEYLEFHEKLRNL